MTTQDVLDHFDGIAKTAKALDISYQAVRQWVDKGEVPEGRQWQIQAISRGKLKADQRKTA